MNQLTEKQAWLALAEAIYGCARLPHHIYGDGSSHDYHCTGLCDAIRAMRRDFVISYDTSMCMIERLDLICDYVGHAYLFNRYEWEPRVDLCLTMYERCSDG